MNKMKIFTVVLFTFLTLSLTAKDYKASLFGAKSDGVTLNTRSIQKAVDFINENGGGRLIFYVGRYLTGTIQLKSNVTIQLEEGAILVGKTSAYDYSGKNGVKAIITADDQQNIRITGKGVIEGQGAAVLEQIKVQIQKGYLKETVAQASPTLIAMNNCSNITIDLQNLTNACGNVQTYSECYNLLISDILIRSTVVKESKGLTLSGCDGVKLNKIFFETSGKEISYAGKSKNVSIVNCTNAKGNKISPTL